MRKKLCVRVLELEGLYGKPMSDILKECYLVEQIGLNRICKKLHIDILQLYRLLKTYGIETRHEWKPNKKQREKITEKIKHKFNTEPEYKQKISDGKKKYYNQNPEAREIVKKQLEELRNINNIRMKTDNEYKARQLKGIYELVKNNGQLKYHPINKSERYIDYILQKNFPNTFKFVGDGNSNIGGLCPDFISTDGSNKIIEVFGDIWHNKELAKKTGLNIKVTYTRTEEGRKKIFKEKGYDCLVIWVSDIRKTKEDYIIKIVNDFLKK